MGPVCFAKENSNPPRCGVHNVLLVQENISIETIIPENTFPITCYVCPISKAVVADPPIAKR